MADAEFQTLVLAGRALKSGALELNLALSQPGARGALLARWQRGELKYPFASTAPFGIVAVRLEDAFFAFFSAGCANVMMGLTPVIGFLQRQHERPGFGFRQRVAGHLLLKAISLLKGCLKFTQVAQYLRVRKLGLQEFLDRELERVGLVFVDGAFRIAGEHPADVLDRFGRAADKATGVFSGVDHFGDSGQIHTRLPQNEIDKTSLISAGKHDDAGQGNG
jgi:hypothetical protein